MPKVLSSASSNNNSHSHIHMHMNEETFEPFRLNWTNRQANKRKVLKIPFVFYRYQSDESLKSDIVPFHKWLLKQKEMRLMQCYWIYTHILHNIKWWSIHNQSNHRHHHHQIFFPRMKLNEKFQNSFWWKILNLCFYDNSPQHSFSAFNLLHLKKCSQTILWDRVTYYSACFSFHFISFYFVW